MSCSEEGQVSPHSMTVLRDLGVVLHVPGLMALASLPLSWLFGEGYAAGPLLITAAASLVPGQVLYWAFRRAEAMRLRHAMVTVVLSWLVIPLVGALPFILVAGQLAGQPGTPETILVFRNLWNAVFESMSGFTSTGLTMTLRPSELPHCLQWWRSFMQWIGGVGVIVLMLSVFHPSGDAYRLYFAEGREKTILPSIAATVRTIWWIYLLYTAVGVLLLKAAGMDWWQAVNYGMTGIATGGFGITDRSMADFGTGPRLVMILLMLAGAISFATHYRLLARDRLSLLWKDAENHALFALLALGSLVLALETFWYGSTASWVDILFQWTSALTTAGFGSVPLETWSPTALLLLSLAMVCGGAAGATTGGLKLRRVVVLADGAYARIRGVALHPWRLMNHRPMADADAEAHAARIFEASVIMAALWGLAVLAGTLLLLHAADPGVALDHVVLEITSALGNVGLTTGITGPGLHWSGKLGLIVVMWLGRLEIVPILVLVAALIMASRHRAAAG
jgi:trk system potassium uptake protein TrkH